MAPTSRCVRQEGFREFGLPFVSVPCNFSNHDAGSVAQRARAPRIGFVLGLQPRPTVPKRRTLEAADPPSRAKVLIIPTATWDGTFPIMSAGSTDRRNTCAKSIGWSLKAQGLSRSLV